MEEKFEIYINDVLTVSNVNKAFADMFWLQKKSENSNLKIEIRSASWPKQN